MNQKEEVAKVLDRIGPFMDFGPSPEKTALLEANLNAMFEKGVIQGMREASEIVSKVHT